MMTTTMSMTETMTTTTTKAQQQPPSASKQRRRWKILFLCCTILSSVTIVVVLLFWNNNNSQQQQQAGTHNFLKGKSYRSSKSTTLSTSSSSSAAKDLANVFDGVLKSGSNRKKKSKHHHHQSDDIHVGNLLEACERLAETIRDLGFSHSANDLMGNINKVRNLYDRYPDNNNNNNINKESIQVLIEYELNAGVHKDVTKSFDEQSASMGLLWLGRNINYQYDLFTYLLSDHNMEPYEAAKKAYQEDLKPHLNWTLQQVGQAALLALKPMKKSTILNKIAGRRMEGGNDYDNNHQEEEDFKYLATIQQDLKQVLSKWKPLLNKYKQTFHDLNLGHKV